MPYLRKEALSKFIGTGCKRQLRLYLTPDNKRYDAERAREGMPKPQPPRPGLEQIAQEGEAWGLAKVADLARTFGPAAVVGSPVQRPGGRVRYEPIDLRVALRQATPGVFLVEAEYAIGPGFERALGIADYRSRFGLEYAHVRPDLIQVRPAGQAEWLVRPDGSEEPLPPGDVRLQLRVIDVKLTAEPSPPYFAEVTYYAMALAGWLEDQGLAERYVVAPDVAIWPGSHDASKVVLACREFRQQGVSPSAEQLRAALEDDLEPAPFKAFAFRLQRFFREELPDVLAAPWRSLPFHVDNRCKSCEFLGYPWRGRDGKSTAADDHCMPTAKRQDHLSRVAFITRGASAALHEAGIPSVEELSRRNAADPAFERHQELRATRSVVAGRAQALATQEACIPERAGGSAILPRWTDLRIFLSADFDLGSAITVAFGLDAFWLQPVPFGAPRPAERARQSWRQVFVVDQKDLEVERRELLAFLGKIHAILKWAHDEDPQTTVQFYLWDSLQQEHLARVIGRHLEAILRDQSLDYLAWLFPPDDLLPNPAFATRRSPVSIVRDAIRALLAAPIPHYYSLLQTARAYHESDLDPKFAGFGVHPLFEDILSDQIPSERAHEIWSRATAPRHWADQVRTLTETVQRRLRALASITRRLTDDLGDALGQTAPRITLGIPDPPSGLSADGQLWYAFAKLNAALAELDVQQRRAMPPHEREARFDSARLQRRLTGAEEQAALAALGLRPALGRRVYALREGSREVKLREGDFNVAISPERQPGLLDKNFRRFTEGTWLQAAQQPHARLEGVLGVTVAGLDRDKRLIALDANRRSYATDPVGRQAPMPDALETLGLLDLSKNAILDPTFFDAFTGRLRATLQAIGNPPAAQPADLKVRRATGQTRRHGARTAPHTPVADVLWCARRMAETAVPRQVGSARAALERHGRALNPTQWRAWEAALTRRLQLIWGPPGTGKSRTVVSVILGAMLEAERQGRPLRILLTAFTYTAIDNVLGGVHAEALALLPALHAEGFFRLRSPSRGPEPHIPPALDVELNKQAPSERVQALWGRLWQCEQTSMVAGTAQQVHNLATMNQGPACQPLFDLIVIDEASQLDVAMSTLALAALAEGGSVVLAGDPRQLPPIHTAEPPLGLAARVGSIYEYLEQVHQVEPIMLDENYRSNETLVRFARDHAGYHLRDGSSTLRSYSPDLRLDLLAPLPATRPADWPDTLFWTPDWASLLDPEHPAVCFVYPEGRSSQSNPFEAEAVAALARLLHGRVAAQLANERDPRLGGTVRPRGLHAYDDAAFWGRGLGIVTPHRAQQGLIVARLQAVFPATAPALLRDAVDTVERFQGQQRDVILASFALGDPDEIVQEDEFLLSLNRFNVLASRARAKLVVFVSQEVVDHLSGDLAVLRESELLKVFVNAFCARQRPVTLGHLVQGTPRSVPGVLRWH